VCCTDKPLESFVLNGLLRSLWSRTIPFDRSGTRDDSTIGVQRVSAFAPTNDMDRCDCIEIYIVYRPRMHVTLYYIITKRALAATDYSVSERYRAK
jgi:hypothetical protein